MNESDMLLTPRLHLPVAKVNSVIDHGKSIGLINPVFSVYPSGRKGAFRIIASSDNPHEEGFKQCELVVMPDAPEDTQVVVLEAGIYAMEMICADLTTRH
jgi:hypothetical protein